MLELLKEEKNKLITAKKALPASIMVPTDEDCSSLEKIDIAQEVRQDIERLDNFFAFMEEYQDQAIIANIGMVNAGKSALFNHLAYQGESGIFKEAPIRETAQVQQIKLNNNTILMDLPGLDSVLSATDDQIVKENIRKANLLLVVIGVHQPIPKHLYDFLQSDEVIKNYKAQRIIIVLNKIDIWDAFPSAHRKKQLETYINFLKNGNSQLNFPGINHLFDYEIPIIPFSVIQARYGIDTWRENVLRDAITNALVDSSSSYFNRAEQELMQCGIKYASLIGAYHCIIDKVSKIGEKVDLLAEGLGKNLNQIVSNEISNLELTIINLKSSCFDDMSRCQPDEAESFWKGTYYQLKKDRLTSYREEYKKKIRNLFDNFANNLKDNISNLIRGTFGECSSIYFPDKELVYESLNNLIYKIWDAHDDVYFLEYSSYSTRVKDKLEAIHNSLYQSACTAINEWINNFLEKISTLFYQAKNNYFEKQASQYISACEQLKEFYEIFTETETFKQLVLIAQQNSN
jgi:small GTP-binding protein